MSGKFINPTKQRKNKGVEKLNQDTSSLLANSDPKSGPNIAERLELNEMYEKFLFLFFASDMSEMMALMGVDDPPVIPANNLPKIIQ
jgi:hypothetical protein